MDREVRDIPDVGTWLRWRRDHMTASRMGALFECHPHLSREQLASDLRGVSVKGDTPAMRRGRIFEPAVAAALQEEHPDWAIEKCSRYYCLPAARIAATPDYFAETPDGPIVIECKTAAISRWEEWHGKIPLHYTLQLLTALMCTDIRRGVLAVMVMGGSYPVHEFAVGRHPEAERRIIEATRAWWEQYDTGAVAPPQSADELEALLDNGEHLDWSGNDEMRELLERRRDLKTEISRLTQDLGKADYDIKNRMAAASTAWLEGFFISFKRQHRKEYIVPAADIRVLRIKETAS